MASASDRARLDRPDSSSFSFTSVFSVKNTQGGVGFSLLLVAGLLSG